MPLKRKLTKRSQNFRAFDTNISTNSKPYSKLIKILKRKKGGKNLVILSLNRKCVMRISTPIFSLRN